MRHARILVSIALIFILCLTAAGCSNNIADNKDITTSTSPLKGKLVVHFLDVGQADSILIQQNGHNMLIDAGNNADSNFVVKYLKKQGVKKIDYVIGTHPHEDHIGGLDVVINTFEIGSVFMPKVSTNTKTFKDVLLAVKSKNMKVVAPVVGSSYNLGDAKWTILAPNSSSYDDLNDYSIVIKINFGKNSFIFTGDAEALSEQEILKKGFNLKADVLKIGHHGSSSSTSDEFLKAVSPEYAAISVGKDNDYGHPHKITMDRLKANNIPVYRTDECGTIIAVSYGEKITFNCKPGDYSYRGIKTESKTNNSANVVISNIDKEDEIVTITNKSSKDINLKGWKIVSVTGNQQYVFSDYILKAGASVKVASGNKPGDLIWGEENVWNNSKSDSGELYDSNGNLVYKYEDKEE
ncbi:MAG: competence protein ComEC [Rikenellaceae bacterium]|nr:competence protein ComEC [Rikenellaceae bacterium]